MVDRLLLSVDEAAQLLGVGRSWLYPRVMRGEIVSVKVGRRRLVPVTALEEFIRRLHEEGEDGNR